MLTCISQAGRVGLQGADPAVTVFPSSTSFVLTGDSTPMTWWFFTRPQLVWQPCLFFSLRDCVPFMLSPWSQPGLRSYVVSELGPRPLYAGSYTAGWGEAYSWSSERRGYRYHLMTPYMGNFIASFASTGTWTAFLKAWNIKRLPHMPPPLSVTDFKGPWLTYRSWVSECTFWKREFWFYRLIQRQSHPQLLLKWCAV